MNAQTDEPCRISLNPVKPVTESQSMGLDDWIRREEHRVFGPGGQPAQQSPPARAPSHTPVAHSRTNALAVGILSVVIVAVLAWSFSTAGTPAPTSAASTTKTDTAVATSSRSVFERAYSACDLASVPGFATIGDAGQTLEVQGVSDSDEPELSSTDALECTLSAVRAPASVIAEMGTTNEVMGRQRASWDGVKASWTVSGGSRIDVILTAPTP